MDSVLSFFELLDGFAPTPEALVALAFITIIVVARSKKGEK